MIKQVIVIRKDLNMRRGKEIAQGSHASMAWLAEMSLQSYKDKFYVMLSKEQLMWLDGLFTKVCVQVNSEAELNEIHEKAIAAGLESHLIVDAGKTEFNGIPTPTCCAIGPHNSEKFEGITTHLKLY